jgi:hypothetical protein
VLLNGACNTVSKTVAKITVIDLNAGAIVANTNQVCAGQSAKLTLNGHIGTIQKWQITTNTSTGPFNDIANTTTSLTHTISTAGTHYFRSVVNTSACSTADVYSDWYAIVATNSSTPVGGSVSNLDINRSNRGNLYLAIFYQRGHNF